MGHRPRTRSRWRLGGQDGRAWGSARSRPHVRVVDASALDPAAVEASTMPHDLARATEATHVLGMQSQTKTPIVGFMELRVGSLAVQVPIRTAEPEPAEPLASFEAEGDSYAILIRGDSSSKAVERAMGEAAREAVAHLSRKLLN